MRKAKAKYVEEYGGGYARYYVTLPKLGSAIVTSKNPRDAIKILKEIRKREENNIKKAMKTR